MLWKWRFGVSTVAVFIAVVLLVGSLIVMSITKVTSNRKKIECAFTTTGTVTDSTEYWMESMGYRITAVYTVDGEEYEATGRSGRSYKPGELVEVHYDRFKPSRSYAAGSPSSFGVYIGSIPLAIASFIFLGANLVRRGFYKSMID